MNKILIVEDDVFLSNMYVTKLEASGFQVEVSSDGKEAMEKIANNVYDLILLDIVLPKIDGFEILEKIKNNPEKKNTPIILLTNLGQKNEVEKGLALGADEYIIKAHFTPTAVVSKIKDVLTKQGKS